MNDLTLAVDFIENSFSDQLTSEYNHHHHHYHGVKDLIDHLESHGRLRHRRRAVDALATDSDWCFYNKLSVRDRLEYCRSLHTASSRHSMQHSASSSLQHIHTVSSQFYVIFISSISPKPPLASVHSLLYTCSDKF